jgi:DNA-binding GntR family transcriptional regulator
VGERLQSWPGESGWNETRMTAPLKHRTLSAAIVDRLRTAILDGSHPAGTQLRQDALAETYGVSRIPVREALFQLEAEGFVRIVPHKGAIVSELSFDEVNDVFDLRALLEPRMLASSAPRFDADDFAGLDAIQARFEAAIAAGDVAQWGAINAEFHLALYAKANQPRTQSIVVALLQTSDRYTRVQLSNTEAMGVAELEHAELIRLCRAGAFVEAGRFLVHHIEAVRRDLLRVLARTT